jgi:cytosine deaminase
MLTQWQFIFLMYLFSCLSVGDGDVLRVCTLLCQVLQLTSTSTARLALAMASTSAARCIGVQHDIAPGLPADLLLLPAASALQVIPPFMYVNI